MTKPLVVFVDVDDTLIRSVGRNRVPMPRTVEHVRELFEEGAILYCWSTGDAQHAHGPAREVGIAECILGVLPDPGVSLDDQAVDWRGTVYVHPLQAGTLGVSEYRRMFGS